MRIWDMSLIQYTLIPPAETIRLILFIAPSPVFRPFQH